MDNVPGLELLCLDPSVSAIRTAVVDMARGPLSWLEGAEQLLDSVGMDLHTSGKGLCPWECGMIQSRSSQTAPTLSLSCAFPQVLPPSLSLSYLVSWQAFHPSSALRSFFPEVNLWSLDSQILESAVTEEKDKCKKSVEEEQRKIQELESHLRSMAEVSMGGEAEQFTLGMKKRESVVWCSRGSNQWKKGFPCPPKYTESSSAQRKVDSWLMLPAKLPNLVSQAVLQQQVLQQSQQLRAVQEEDELQRQKLQEEVAGYREQSRQHSLTILALEDRLLEATQQQKVLEEEKVALVEKMEGSEGSCQGQDSAGMSPIVAPMRVHQLQIPQDWVVSQPASHEAVLCLGELSEEQKVELEHSQRQLKHREWEVNQLREKLSEMSSLVEEKDQALRAAADELRYTLTSPKASRMPLCVSPAADGVQGSPQSKSAQCLAEPPSALAELGAKCRGLRHEETIQRQKEGLAELRERVKMLEKRQCSGEQGCSRTMECFGPNMGSMGLSLSLQVPDHVPNGSSFRITNSTVSLEMAEVTDMGEKMYLDVIGALGSLVEMKELSGMQPLQHLPQERRTEVGLQRQKALELLYKKIRNLQVRLERKEKVLKDYEESVEQLRQSQASLRRCQEEMSNLEDEAHRGAEEKALLREALERMQLQLDQEKMLRQAAKRRKVRRRHPGSPSCPFQEGCQGHPSPPKTPAGLVPGTPFTAPCRTRSRAPRNSRRRSLLSPMRPEKGV
uniref:FHAD1 protein n=1 Tax=Junco hyemalis TaxID=40217 RepID=A0A8C5JK15_JUNHY